MTKETGIIMSGNHPVKILDGPKTQTRRTYGLEMVNDNPDLWVLLGRYVDGYNDKWRFRRHGIDEEVIIKCPYGGIGDLLWVRETHQFELDGEGEYLRTLYKADGGDYSDWGTESNPFKWRPSIHMFRKDSRIERIITGLRPERLQAITNADAKAKGCVADDRGSESDNYHNLWDKLNGKRYPWAGNWWVWVISF